MVETLSLARGVSGRPHGGRPRHGRPAPDQRRPPRRSPRGTDRGRPVSPNLIAQPVPVHEPRGPRGRRRLAGRSTLRRAPDIGFTPAGAEPGVSLPASPVDLLDEGLRAG